MMRASYALHVGSSDKATPLASGIFTVRLILRRSATAV
jgi:hypothetical protein